MTSIRCRSFLTLCLLLLSLLGTVAHAQTPASGSMRLSAFTAQAGPVRLTDVASSVDLFIPLSGLVKMRDARVELRFSNSIALLSERSYLLVRMNDISVAQIPLDPLQPTGTARFTLPDDLWEAGFNRLSIGVIQHYTDLCEDNLAPELWTDLDLFQSRLDFSLVDGTAPLTLSDLGEAFGPGIGAIDRVTLVSSADDAMTGVQAAALPLVAQSLALRRRFMPLLVEHVEWHAEAEHGALAGPHVLVGTAEALAPLLAFDAVSVKGPYLGINRTPVERDQSGRVRVPSQVQVVVSGRTPEEVIEAARTLAQMDDALNPVEALTVLGREQSPAYLAPLAREVLHAERTYRFADLGLPTHSMRGFGAHGVGLDVRLPADYYTHDSAQIELLLDLGYGAGMGPGSVMNVFLNGEFVHGRLLEEPHGAMFHSYRIVLPARRFMPGNNRVDFELTLRPEVVAGECAGLDGRHLVAQLMGTSTIKLPDFGSASRQPNLKLFGSTGFPFTSLHAETRFDLNVAGSEQFGPALTLVGRIAQAALTAHDGWRLNLGLDALDTGSRSIVLAPTEALPDALFADWSVALGRSTRWPYAALNDLRSTTGSGEGGLAALMVDLLGLRHAPTDEGPAADALRGSVAQDGGLGPLGGLSLLRNPLSAENAPVLVITAANSERLAERVATLVTPQVWSQLDGGLMLWRDTDSPVTTMRVAGDFEIGERSDWLLLRLWLSNQPWYWLALVVTGALLVVFSAGWLLRRRRARLDQQA